MKLNRLVNSLILDMILNIEYLINRHLIVILYLSRHRQHLIETEQKKKKLY